MLTPKNFFLLASVFATGACVLVVEVVAFRILSPYFGNTIYSSSSVIGVILGALSLGYYIGGRLADKFPQQSFFYGIICVSGLLVLFMQAMIFSVLPVLSMLFSIAAGPLVASVVLFLVPALCFGMLSPFAVRLHGTSQESAGSTSGEVFFWSTLGSIFGSLAAGFYLIPHFGLAGIIIGTAIFLMAWGLAGLAYYRAPYVFLTTIILLALCASAFIWLGSPVLAASVLYDKNGVYEHLTIKDGEWEGRPTRFLLQDRSFSAGMDLETRGLAFDYTKYYQLYKLVNPAASQALVVGGGAYSIPGAYLASSPTLRVDVAEIEPGLLDLAKEYFSFSPDPERFTNAIEDGRRLLAQSSKVYDVMYIDVYYSLFSVPAHFTTQEFFRLAKERLSENGVFIANFGGFLQGEGSAFIASEMKTFNTVFPNHYYFAVKSPDFAQAQNIIFMGVNGDTPVDIEQESRKQSDAFFAQLPLKLIDEAKVDISAGLLMTDNYAPVEYLVGKIFNVW